MERGLVLRRSQRGERTLRRSTEEESGREERGLILRRSQSGERTRTEEESEWREDPY